MKIDTDNLRAKTDLAALLAAELGPANRAGAWPCPFHPDKTPSFGIVKNRPETWHCFSCGASGDSIGFLMRRHGLSFRDACARLAGPAGGLSFTGRRPKRQAPALVRQSEPPADLWAARAETIATDAARQLWEPAGLEGLEYLRGRGFADSAIRAAGLGWLAEDRHEPAGAWGLPDADKDVFLPAGVLIPWRDAAGRPFRLNVRRLAPGTGPKYLGPAGWKPGLYLPQPLAGLPVVLVEGEFDALAILQAAGDLCRPAATGSATGGRTARDVYALAACPRRLLAFDADRAGDDAAQFWQGIFPNAERLRPPVTYKDPGAMPAAELRAWIAKALGQSYTARLSDARRAAVDTAVSMLAPCREPVRPFPESWLQAFDADTLEQLARMTLDGTMTDAEALAALGLSDPANNSSLRLSVSKP